MVIFRLIPFLTAIWLVSSAQDTAASMARPLPANLLASHPQLVASKSFSYRDYAEVLKTYVDRDGLVNYEGLQANREQLDCFNRSLGEVAPEVYLSWSDREKLAFLINAYNSFTLQSIIDRQPLEESIRDIPGVWKRRQFAIAGEQKTLDNIEHDTIRREFNEPRIHAALVCAANSCPPLLNEPYLPETLDAQLEERIRRWLSSPQGFRIDRQKERVSLSAIFKWYGKDWQESYSIQNRFSGNAKERAVLNFVSGYLAAEDVRYLEEGNYRVNYLPYDWSLNKQR